MWTRSLLKSNAKTALAPHYWRAFLVCLVAGLFLGGSNGMFTYRMNSDGNTMYYEYANGYAPHVSSGAVAASSIAGIIALLLTFFVCNIVLIGTLRYFMEARVGSSPFATMFSAFGGPNYMNEVKTMFFRDLYTFLWSLLLVVPGIIKYYQYSMVPYILCENPGIDTARAFELSKQMTDGEKWNMFVLDLSFIGWYLLCAVTFGIGFLFLAPYTRATGAELYSAMRAKAFAAGWTDETELGDFVRY